MTNLPESTPRQVVSIYQKRWAIELVNWELKSGLGLGQHQVSGDEKRSENSIGVAVLAYLFFAFQSVIMRSPLADPGVFFSFSMRCNYER